MNTTMEGASLKRWRRVQRWTLEQTAHYLGTTVTRVEAWEAGVEAIPQTVVILAALLRITENVRMVDECFPKG